MELDELIATQTIDHVDTPKEGDVQYDKRNELKKIIEQGDAHLLHGNNRKKWTIERIDKATDKQIDNYGINTSKRRINKKRIRQEKLLVLIL